MTCRNRENQHMIWLITAAITFAMIAMFAGEVSVARDGLIERINLTGIPEAGMRYYQMTTEVIEIGMDGKRKAPDLYKVWIEYTSKPKEIGNIVTCRQFTLRSGVSPTVELPPLKNWTYTFRKGIDERGMIFGIDQSKFEEMIEKGPVVRDGSDVKKILVV